VKTGFLIFPRNTGQLSLFCHEYFSPWANEELTEFSLSKRKHWFSLLDFPGAFLGIIKMFLSFKRKGILN